MKYRADIDGLRAIAVLTVIIFHFKSSALPSGYLGVDIFFVLSGYLITRIINDELKAKNFTLRGFYERRIRRIFPAFITVLGVSSIAAYLLFLPQELLLYSKSALASLAFSSNILFFNEAGYFDTNSNLKPLLHTWSLAVEEQFYIVFPLIMIALHKWATKHIKSAIIVLLILSLGAYSYYVFIADALDFAFYMLPMRAWELLIGSIIAVKSTAKKESRLWLVNIINIIGFSLIVLSFALSRGFFFDLTQQSSVKFFQTLSKEQADGFLNILVTIGTGLVLYAGGKRDIKNVIATFLSLKPFTFLGKISYSLYLWHWPAFVFVNYYMLNGISKGPKIILALATIGISYLSWRFIEQPIRARKHKLSHEPTLRLGLIAALLVTISSAILFSHSGFSSLHKMKDIDPQKVSGGQPNMASIVDQNGKNLGGALGASTKLENVSFALYGDSHARAIQPALYNAAIKTGKTGIYKHSRCVTLPEDFPENIPAVIQACAVKTQEFLKFLNENPQIKTVFIAQRWIGKTDAWGKTHKIKNPYKVLKFGLLHLVQELEAMGRQVVILEQVPLLKINDNSVLSLYWRMAYRGLDTTERINATHAYYVEKQKPMQPIYAFLKEKTQAQFVQPVSIMCPENETVCKFKDENEFWYEDDDHLSTYGAQQLTPLFEPYLND